MAHYPHKYKITIMIDCAEYLGQGSIKEFEHTLRADLTELNDCEGLYPDGPHMKIGTIKVESEQV